MTTEATPDLTKTQDAGSLSPGERQGEGERDAANRNARTNSATSTPPAPRLRVDSLIEREAFMEDLL